MGALRKLPTRTFVPGTPGSPGTAAQQVCQYTPPPTFVPPNPPPGSGAPPQTCYQLPAQIVCDRVFNPQTGQIENVNCRIYVSLVCP